MAWWHQAITWTNVDWSSVKSCDIHMRAISQEISQPSITNIFLKITCLKFHSNFPGANELTHWGLVIQICTNGHNKENTLETLLLLQWMTLNVFKDCHAGYSNSMIHSTTTTEAISGWVFSLSLVLHLLCACSIVYRWVMVQHDFSTRPEHRLKTLKKK